MKENVKKIFKKKLWWRLIAIVYTEGF